MSVKQYDANAVILALAKELKQIPECKMPEWAGFVKTGVGKQGPPTDPDWWYVRSASILRKIALLGPIGVNKLRRYYGGKHRRGYAPPQFERASGKIIRVCLQQLQKASLIKENVVAGHKGRVLDTKGMALLSVSIKASKPSLPVKEKSAPKATESKDDVKETASTEVSE